MAQIRPYPLSLSKIAEGVAVQKPTFCAVIDGGACVITLETALLKTALFLP